MSRSESASGNFYELPNRVLVVTALSLEFSAAIRHLDRLPDAIHPNGGVYGRGTFLNWNVLVAETGPGNAPAAQATERAIQYAQPELAIFVGVAGGLKDVCLGDVVASRSVPAYEYGADRDTFQPRGSAMLPSYPLVQQALSVHRDGSWVSRIETTAISGAAPQSFVGPIAAGEKIIKSSEGAVARLLRQHYSDALAVEMEGAGFLYAAYTSSVDAIVVRGISDLLDGKAQADSDGWQQRAAAHAAAFAMELLASVGRGGTSAIISQASAASEAGTEGQDLWTAVRNVAPRLYPRGPDDHDVWENAGGELATLNLNEDGRTQWSRALRTLEKGGGGRNISLQTLLGQMHGDYPKNLDVAYLLARVSGKPPGN